MSFCNPQLIDGKLTCHKCGNDFPISLDEFAAMNNDTTRITRVCIPPITRAPVEIAAHRAPPLPPPFPRRFANYIWSTTKHLAHGMPRCTQKQIDTRLEICRACPSNQFIMREPDAEIGMCAACGCCASNADEFNNKLARADESCPLAHWGPVVKMQEKRI